MTAEKSEFWSATEQLNLIYRWARASYVAPWALLAAVLPRVIATTGPHVMLPGPPAPASLNMGVVLVGRSGAGKGVTDKLSRVVWPADIHEEGLGSGQGIAELFKQQKNQEDQIDRALITVSEIDHLAALNAGQGNNTRAALKAALTGDRLGSKGASAATTRAVPADSYRLCLSISAQFGHCGVLLDDVSGGTPQRPLWMLVTDPDMPKEVGPIPDRVLDIALPPWARSGSQVLIQYGPPEIREYINAGLWASGRGDVAAIDGHRTLTRLKVAAALAVLDHRSVIGEADWQLSEVIMAKSDATRDAVMEYDRQAARAKIRDRAMARARGEEFVSDHKLHRAKSAVIRWLGRDTELAANQLRSKLKADLRDHFGAAVAELVAEGLIAEIHVERGTRYRLTSEVQGVPPVQGPYPQLNEGVPEVQGVQRPADALRCVVDKHAIADLNSRRSPENGQPSGSARQWLNDHIRRLQNEGQTEVESFAVFSAGQAAGHPIEGLRTAASRHPEVRVITRTPRSSRWDITGSADSTYRPATEWVDEYIGRLPGNTSILDREDFRAAAQAAGYTWTAARHAALNHQRITSVPAEGDSAVKRLWIISPPPDQEAAAAGCE
ncbi:hypothetical protein PJJ28_14530 [Mycobacterium kansasii]